MPRALTIVVIKAGESLLLELPDQEQDQSEDHDPGDDADPDNGTGRQPTTRLVLALGVRCAVRVASRHGLEHGSRLIRDDPALRTPREGLHFGHKDDGSFGVGRDSAAGRKQNANQLESMTRRTIPRPRSASREGKRQRKEMNLASSSETTAERGGIRLDVEVTNLVELGSVVVIVALV